MTSAPARTSEEEKKDILIDLFKDALSADAIMDIVAEDNMMRLRTYYDAREDIEPWEQDEQDVLYDRLDRQHERDCQYAHQRNEY